MCHFGDERGGRRFVGSLVDVRHVRRLVVGTHQADSRGGLRHHDRVGVIEQFYEKGNAGHGVFADETKPAGCVPADEGRSVLCRLHKIIEGAAGVRAECCDRIDGTHPRLFIRRGGECRPQGVDRRWGGG